MLNRLRLFREFQVKFTRTRLPLSRKLYTDTIYPYPHHYVNTVRWPSQACYRETFNNPPWHEKTLFANKWMMRVFWTYWWYMLFTKPDAITGHALHLPDPSKFTDSELGVPPDEEGPYYEWLARKHETMEPA